MFLNDWLFQFLFMPNIDYFRDSAARSFSNINKIEHLHESSVSGIGYSAEQHLNLTGTTVSRICKRDSVGMKSDYNAP